MKIVMKCDNGGYMIQPEKHYHKKMEKQLKYNQAAKVLRVYAEKLIEKADELEKKTGWNEYLKSFKDKSCISMNMIDDDHRQEAEKLLRNKVSNKLNARRKAEKRLQVRAYKKEVGCASCGYKDNPDILHFHHRDPNTKVNNVSRMLGKNHSMEKIKAEIEKCDLLCISCHHKHHGIENAAS